MNFAFTKYSKVYYTFSAILIVASIASLMVFGLKFGIEFTGGSTMELEFKEMVPSNDEISNALSEFNLGEIIVQPTANKSVFLKFKEADEQTHQDILNKINQLSPAEEKSFQYIGPSVGKELKNKTQIAILVVLIAITLYIAFAFRKVSRPVASWKYGVTSLVALFHDILIPLGAFSILGEYYNAEITIPIIAALLTVLGFSVHDTIVVFDRIRENLLHYGSREPFRAVVDKSLNQTVGRSISTVVTVLLMMLAIFFFGGETLKYFSLALIIGIASGTYSSILIATPLLVSWHDWSEKDSARK